MVITQTPFRMSFFGGGTDFPGFFKEYGGSVISTTFDKYCYVIANHLPGFFDYKYQVTYNIIERTKEVDEIKHPLVRELMKYLDMRDLRVSYEADLPARTGLGTSSAFAVGLLSAFYSIKGKYVDKRKLADDAIYAERILCNESGGWQDQIASAFGGLNRIDFNASGYQVSPLLMREERKEQLNDNLLLYFTGVSRFSSDIQKDHEKSFHEKRSQLLEMKALVDDAQRILTSKSTDLSEFGKLLDYAWKLKRGITSKISTNEIDEIYAKALKAGAIGGKLLGAGGGGFLLFYVEKDKQQSVMEALDGMLNVPFRFENYGTRIMYYKAESYKLAEEMEA